ncbi:hypothetical protein HOY82DRAFT_539114 [Tuber indicum]|nr:hypothetical protein HOY82DRAFT_539114 [Tuber indicum]
MNETRLYIDLAAKAYRSGAFNLDTLKTIALSDFGDGLGRYAWMVIKPVAAQLLLNELFTHYITPFFLLSWDIWANDAQYPLRTLYWLSLWVPITINKIVLYPSVSIAMIPLLMAAFTLSYLRIIQNNRVHPLELWFWRTRGDEFDWRLQHRLAQVLEERQIRRREEKYRDIPMTPLLTDEEFLDVATVVDGIRYRKNTAIQAQLDSYREYSLENAAFPTIPILDRYYRAGWDTSIYMLREFDSNYQFCRPVRWHTDIRTGVIDCFNGYKTRASGDLMANHQDLVVGSISVMRPVDIRPALKLIKGAFNHLRFYSTTYMRGGLHIQRQKWREGIAIHVEYLRFPPEFERGTVRKLDVDVEGRDERETQSTGDGKQSVYVQRDRELINILTVTGDFCLGYAR